MVLQNATKYVTLLCISLQNGEESFAKEFLLVDGYNIIHAWEDLKELAQDVSLVQGKS